jgi:hypothetical protein
MSQSTCKTCQCVTAVVFLRIVTPFTVESIPYSAQIIINHMLQQNGSELKKSVPVVQQKCDLIAEFQNGETVTKLAEGCGLNNKPNISNNK